MNAILLVTTVPGFVRNPFEKQQADNYRFLEAFHANPGSAKKGILTVLTGIGEFKYFRCEETKTTVTQKNIKGTTKKK